MGESSFFYIAVAILLAAREAEAGNATVEEEQPGEADTTHSVTWITSEEMARWPIRGYSDAVSLQSGVTAFHKDLEVGVTATEESRNGPTLIVRGGRPAHVGYFVDGFLQQDLLTGISTISVTPTAISHVMLAKPSFEVEHGRFQSGMINVLTREGGAKLSGSLEGVTDNLSGRWIGADATDYNVYAATLGGPILDANRTLFAAVERRWIRDRQPSAATRELADMARSVLGPGDITASEQVALDALSKNILPSNSLDGWSWNGKLAFKLSDSSKLTLAHQGVIDKWQRYEHSYLFDHVHTPLFEDRAFSGSARYTHDLNPVTSLSMGFHYLYAERNRGDGQFFSEARQYSRPFGNPFADEFAYLFFDVDDPSTPVVRSGAGIVIDGDEGHVFDDYLRHISSAWEVSSALNRRIGRRHELKVGGDYRRHTLRRYEHFFPTNLLNANGELTASGRFDASRYGFNIFGGIDHEDPLEDEKHPIDFALFGQDRIHLDPLTLMMGLRYDHFHSNTEALVDPTRPLDGGTPGILDDMDLRESESFARVSPRLGASVLASPTTWIHLNYGRFFQPSTFQHSLLSYRYLEHKVNIGGYFSDFGNPDLEPEETTAYEVGIAQRVVGRVRLDVSTYHKTFENAVTLLSIFSQSPATKSYAGYVNGDLGTMKGMDVDLAVERSRRLAATFSYGLSFAEGTGSLPGSQRDIAWTGGEPGDENFPLDFDQRHKVVLDIDYRFEPGEGPGWGPVRPLASAGINMLITAASGTPFTGTQIFNEVTLANVAAQPKTSLNALRGPSTYQVDLKVDKGFQVGGLDWNAYVWVLNLFDRDNVIDVYTSSGSATTTRFLTTANGQAYIENVSLDGSDADVSEFYRMREFDPTHFSIPRLVRFGLKAAF